MAFKEQLNLSGLVAVQLILKQLNELYPAVNNDQLYDVLQSTNFDVR